MAHVENRRRARRLIQDSLHASSVGMIRGNGEHRILVCRWGYFYRTNRSPEKYVEAISTLLTKHNIEFSIIDFGDHWVPFKGGASVARQSHFYVHVDIA